MSKPLHELMNLLQLEQLDTGLFRGHSEHLGLAQVYGGQVIGQALSGARYTVPNDRIVHSFHSYFLLPGDPNKPIIYDVDTLRDGKSLSTRRVKAIQNGQPIFYLTASYHVIDEEKSFEHQKQMPQNVPEPETLLSETELAKLLYPLMPEALQKMVGTEKAIETRPVKVINPLAPEKSEARQYLWIKANGEVPDNQLIHQYLLGYASDWGFLNTALFPHQLSMLTPKFQVATIDHSIWFHRPFRIDEWLLYAIDSPTVANSRGLVHGEIYNRQGQLVASAVQEGIMRFKK